MPRVFRPLPLSLHPGAVAHGCLIVAFSLSEASCLAPLLYTELLNQALLGYLVWGDVPDGLAALGMVLIIAAGLFLGLTERHQERQQQGQRAREPSSEMAGAGQAPTTCGERQDRSGKAAATESPSGDGDASCTPPC